MHISQINGKQALRLLMTASLALLPSLAWGQSLPSPSFKSLNILKPTPFGTFSDTVALSVQSNLTTGSPQVSGFGSPSQLGGPSGYKTNISSASLYVDNTARPILATASAANYTATQLLPVTALSPSVVAQLQAQIAACTQAVCTIIQTNHSPEYMASITGVAPDGTSVTVSGWYQAGNTATGQVPSNGVDAYIDPDAHPYGQNIVTYLNSSSYADMTTGLEIDVLNSKANFINGSAGNALGMAINCHGPYTCSNAYMAQGGTSPSQWYNSFFALANYNGYIADKISNYGFAVQHDTIEPAFGFITFQSSGYAFMVNPGSTGSSYSVNTFGGVNMGNFATMNGVAITPVASGSNPSIQTAGPDANINLTLTTKGTGSTYANGSVISQGNLEAGYQAGSADAAVKIGDGRTATGNAEIFLISDTTYPVYGLRILRGNQGANANSAILNRGTGVLDVQAVDTGGTVTLSTAGVARVNVGSSLVGVSLPLQFPVYSVATLPTCNSGNQYSMAAVSDQNGTPTYNGALTGGGTIKIPVFCNGTTWTAH